MISNFNLLHFTTTSLLFVCQSHTTIKAMSHALQDCGCLTCTCLRGAVLVYILYATSFQNWCEATFVEFVIYTVESMLTGTNESLPIESDGLWFLWAIMPILLKDPHLASPGEQPMLNVFATIDKPAIADYLNAHHEGCYLQGPDVLKSLGSLFGLCSTPSVPEPIEFPPIITPVAAATVWPLLDSQTEDLLVAFPLF
eukprot:m.13588 g.13588  ORF g.13588 m.13588 type:complete len:198 (-) comp2840_c0_seq1:90-683(-)